MNCYILDDEPAAIEILSDYVRSTPGLSLAGSSREPQAALLDILSPDGPDITFADIAMQPISGMELAGLVTGHTQVVFTTAHPQFALTAFEKQAFDFLLKPISYDRFLQCFAKIQRTFGSRIQGVQDEEFFTIKSEIKGRLIKITFAEVIYVEAASNYLLIFTVTDTHKTYLSIQELIRHLPAERFVRIHRSFLVNIAYVKIIEKGRLKLEDGRQLPLGDFHKANLLNRVNGRLISYSQ